MYPELHTTQSKRMASKSPASAAADAPLLDDTNGGNSNKRKAEPHSGTHTRAKRNRYISLACNECKRRKIRCNGNLPCQRCGHLKLECLYAPNCCNSNFKDSEEFRSMKQRIDSLQEQVNTLFTNINDLYHQKAEIRSLDNNNSNGFTREASRPLSVPQSVLDSQQTASPTSRSRHPRFHGPTSTEFNFNVAKSSLQTMGIAPVEESGQELFTTGEATPIDPVTRQLPPFPQLLAHPDKDPLWSIKREEAIRLCQVYEEEIGIMYPILDVEKLIVQTNLLFTFLEAADRTGFTRRFQPGADCLFDDDTCVLKMVLAITLVVEGNGQSTLGSRFFASAKQKADIKLWEPPDIRTIKLLSLVATYYFHTDNDVMAYRFIGMAARMCLELGLHRRDAVLRSFSNEEELASVIKLFWSVYSLDRRWSFGTGLPFVIQDEDIDSNLPEPDESVPYLRTMVPYCRITSKIWYSGLGSGGTMAVKRDTIGFLDYQVVQWLKQVPEELRFYSVDTLHTGEAGRGLRRLRVLLYIRGNHMRILIYRPVLHSTTSIMENMTYAQTVVDVAKDTIGVLSRLNQTSDIYHTQQVLFNYFLVAALAVLLLAVCHAPMEFNRQVRDEFYMALDIIKGFSTKSYVSKRLWKMIKGLRGIGEKLGLLSRPVPPDVSDPHSTAAVAMAGLAGHPIDMMSVYNGDLGSSPLNGLQMSNELTNLFEAAGGFGNFLTQPPDGLNGELVSAAGDLQNTGEGLPAVLGNEGEFARVMRDIF